MGHAASAPRTARGLLVLCAALWGCMAQAAWVSDGSQKALNPAPSASEPRAGVLDRALQLDAQAQQRNLDLLLDAREAPDGAALLQRGGAQGSRVRSPVLPQDMEAVQAPGAPPTPRMLGLRANEEARAGATTARQDWRFTGQGGAGNGAGPGGAAAERTGADGAGGQRQGRSSEELEGLRLAMQEAREFVLEHRYTLLGGVVMVGLLIAVFRGFMHRR